MAVVRNQMQLLIHIVGSQDLTGQSFKFQFPAFNYRQRVGLYIVAKPATRVVHERWVRIPWWRYLRKKGGYVWVQLLALWSSLLPEPWFLHQSSNGWSEWLLLRDLVNVVHWILNVHEHWHDAVLWRSCATMMLRSRISSRRSWLFFALLRWRWCYPPFMSAVLKSNWTDTYHISGAFSLSINSSQRASGRPHYRTKSTRTAWYSPVINSKYVYY